MILLKTIPISTILKPHFSITFGKSATAGAHTVKSFKATIWFFCSTIPTGIGGKRKKHLIDIYAEKCGVTLDQRRPAIYLSDSDLQEAQNKLDELGISNTDKLFILAPETRSKQNMREWPHERITALIQKIIQHHECKVITFASKNNPNDYNGTIQLKGFPLGPSSAMISKAWMFLGVDNGLTHIASCFDV